MQLLIIRHAIAVERGTPGIPDADRPLTPEGEERFAEAAKGLAGIVDRPDALLTSPLLRAKQTASLAAAAWGQIEPTDAAALAGGSFDEYAAVLDRYRGDSTVAIVGHEPHLSAVLARLLGSRSTTRSSFITRARRRVHMGQATRFRVVRTLRPSSSAPSARRTAMFRRRKGQRSPARKTVCKLGMR